MDKAGNKYLVKPFSVTIDPCHALFLPYKTKSEKKKMEKVKLANY
jgi:hypothetical protein